MANSLKDQLLKVGLVTEEQVRQAQHDERRQRKRGGNRKRKDAAGGDAKSSERHALSRRQRAKRERDQKLNEARERERKNQALRQQVRDLVLGNSLNDGKADQPYNIVRGSRVRRIYVTAAQRDALAAGELAVTTARGRHHVISTQTAERVLAVMPDYFIYRTETAPASADDDAYADFKVPDDLMW